MFLDTDGLGGTLGVTIPPGGISAPWEHYERVVREHGYELRDDRGALAARGDVHFAFPAPERAFEDQSVVRELVAQSILPRRVAATLLMVDFANPVFSRRREALLAHVPAAAHRSGGLWDLESRLVESIQRAADAGSPEAEFATLWEAGEAWSGAFAAKIAAYVLALQAALEDRAGFDAIARCIASRRDLARHRPLLEFGLTLPFATRLPTARIRMRADGTTEEEEP
jgi:hypothetical protein